jgi:hypothetical protein
MTIDIQPIKIGNEHYVGVIMDGHEMSRRGPFLDADAAEDMAERMRRAARALTSARLNRGSNHG